ncbi:MAG: amidohydrolase [Anaerovorax sp.]|nr:amidohydrolase [Anaerovorax sp.]
MKIKIEHANILRMVQENEGVITGDLAIDGEDIAFIGEVPNCFVADKTIDGSNTLVIPGLINAHTHTPMSIFRNYANDLELMDWLNTAIFPAEDRMDEECGYYGALLSMIELIQSGCTAFEEQYMFVDSIAKAALESGMRANIARGLVGDGKEEGSLQRLQENIDFHHKWHGKGSGRIRVDFGPHAPYTCQDGILKKVVDAVDALPDSGIHIHLCETQTEVEGSIEQYGMTPIERMERIGLFGQRRVIAAHGVHLTENDISILKKYNVHIVHNPSSNLKLASGFAPVAKLMNAGVNVALGTDGSSSNNNVNMVEELHIAGILAKAVAKDAKALPAYDIIKMATINGAKALGIDDQVGTIEVGKKADLAIIDMSGAHWYPQTDLIAAVAYSMQGSDVRDVICNGRLLMENRKLLTISEKSVICKVQKLSEKVLNQI